MMTSIALALVSAFTPVQAQGVTDSPFPPSTALAESVSPDGLKALSELVQSFVDADEIVGAELLVIVNDKTVLHAAYGWRDRDEQRAMEPGSVFCVRSMTKPLIGAAVAVLLEANALELDDPVAKFLPAFDVEGKRAITIEQLLTHTSGLPMSLIMSRDPRSLTSLREVADLGGACKLEFEPGHGFNYSDQGTDTLAAVLEVVSGMPAERYVREHLLEPLGMRDSVCVMEKEHPLRARASSAYMGARGSWSRFWSPADAPLFPIFLGSQALYSTAVDYARFLDFFLHQGRAGGERLLRASSVRSTLEAGPFEFGTTAWPGVRVGYGRLMQVWTRPDKEGESEVVAFGHSGSDGTWAWAFPAQHALVMYFTQSRGAPTGQRVEEQLGALFLGAHFDPKQAAPPLEPYLGYYYEGEGDTYRAIVRDGDELALEILGRAVVPLDYIGEDRWKLRPEPANVIAFDRDETGAVTGYHIGEHVEFRIKPRADLPSVDEVAAQVAAAHGLEKLASAGAVRLRGEIEMPKLQRDGETELWLQWPDRWRTDDRIGSELGSQAFDGSVLRQKLAQKPVSTLEGEARALTLQGDPFSRFGDWRREGAPLVVIQELVRPEGRILLVRAGDCSAPAPTFYVQRETGRVLRMDGLTFIEGLGRLGQRMQFSDWRDVGGALLPGKIELELAHPLIGRITSEYDEIELDVDAPPGLFTLEN